MTGTASLEVHGELGKRAFEIVYESALPAAHKASAGATQAMKDPDFEGVREEPAIVARLGSRLTRAAP
jgi:hypothetical protein